MNNRVACDCGRLRGAGHFEVDGEWLVLTSTLGEHRVRLGISNPKKLAATLLKNLCFKAAAAPQSNAVEPIYKRQSILNRAQELVDIQQEKISAMEADDPERAVEERSLDQMVETSRIVEKTNALLASEEAEDARSSSP